MDRRQYLGLTGASIVALLGGCSSLGGGGQPDPTATATETETATDTATATETEEPTSSPTQTPRPEEEFLVNDDFETAYRESTPGEKRHTDIRAKVENNYNWAEVESQLEEADEVEFGEIVLEGLSDVYDSGDLTTWENAKEMAKAARYVIHKGLDPEYRKEVLGEEQTPINSDHSRDFDVTITESGEIENNGYIVLPNVMTLNGVTEHGVDIGGEGYLTSMVAEARGKPSDPTGTYRIFDGNILDSGEKETYLNGTDEERKNFSLNEAGMADGFYMGDDEKGEENARIEIYPIVKTINRQFGFGPKNVDEFNRYLSKIIPGVPGTTENGTPYAQIEEEAHKKIYEDFISGNFMDYRIRLHNEYKKVDEGEIGAIELSNENRLIVDPQPETSYSNSQVYI